MSIAAMADERSSQSNVPGAIVVAQAAESAELRAVRRGLRSQGFSRIEFEKRTFPFVVAACRRGNRERLVVLRDGRIRNALGSTRSSACDRAADRPAARTPAPARDPALSSAELRRILRGEGFRRIEITDAEPPRYRAEACQRNRRVRLRLNARGEVTNTRRIGRCDDTAQRPRPAPQPVALSERDLRARLRDEGYRRIEITDATAPTYRAEACLENNRRRVDINAAGEITRSRRIGACRQANANRVTVRDARKVLQDRGFTRIEVISRNAPFVFELCDRRERKRVRVNARGRIASTRTIGRCGRRQQARLSANELRTILRRLDYRQISFTELSGPTYQAEACEGRTRYRVTIDADGDIEFRERIGRCRRGDANNTDRNTRPVAGRPGALTPQQVRQRLRARGFNRIRFTDRQLPLYVVEACRNNRKLRLSLTARGRVRDRNAIGRCAENKSERGYTPAEVRDVLRQREYYNISFADRELPTYVVEACRRGRAFRLRLNRFGDIRRRRTTGRCSAPLPREIREALAAQQVEDVNIDQIRRIGRIDPDECQDILERLLSGRTINFATGSSTIERNSFELLERLAFVLKQCPRTVVEVAGHTDSVGSRSNNQTLSNRRANSVVRFLREQGVPRARLDAVGYGEDFPIASNDTSSGRRFNRRIEFVGSWSES
ncbi:MAG: OmpA family protein [Pseudomonadota bacterium]